MRVMRIFPQRTDRDSESDAFELGVSMIEFALALPIFFLIVFGFFDVARYWQAKAALQQAAWEGVNEFAINRDIKKLGSTDPDDTEKYQAAYDSIRTQIRARAAQLALSAGGNIEKIDEVIPSMPPSSAELYKVPVEITILADFHGTFLPISMKVRSKTSGYIETFRTTSQPLITDCWGHPFDETDPPGSEDYGEGCPCNNGGSIYTDYDSDGQEIKKCACSSENYTQYGTVPQTGPDGSVSCGCPDGKVRVETFTDVPQFSSEQNQGMKNERAICCPPGSPASCPAGQLRQMYVTNDPNSPTACACACAAGATADGNGTCQCDNPLKKYYGSDTYGVCYCKPDLPSCGHGHRDPTTCECICDYQFVKDANGLCYCDKSPAYCRAIDPNLAYGGGQCRCFYCDAGKTAQPDNNGCHCLNQADPCPDPNMSRNGNDCNCYCNSPLWNSNGKCCPQYTTNMSGICCPNEATNSGGVCVCPTGKHLSADGTKCECDLTCTNGFTISNPSGGSCSCVCSGSRETVSSGGTNYCSPQTQDCKATCTFTADGSCSNCPPG